MKILNSASRVVLILMTLALIGLTFMKIVDPKDFVGFVGMVFVYYFTKNNQGGSTNQTRSASQIVSQTTTGETKSGVQINSQSDTKQPSDSVIPFDSKNPNDMRG